MTTPNRMTRSPQRGEIWFVKLPTDPPEKNERPVVIVSIEARNAHERATTVLVVPLSTTPPRLPTHIALALGETGLSDASTIQAENITTVRKTSLHQPKQRLHRLSESVIERIARAVQMAMGFPDRA
ncbi:MAG TPA: type II toxin-antitoxin system PemK/MazF family toxin [Candidatus Sulfotelmatobacter sp.]|nr:type II toxin-antitoxin system PemK/MazF family toxin [Candidatus Sulfotelmatobacter sp.]